MKNKTIGKRLDKLEAAVKQLKGELPSDTCVLNEVEFLDKGCHNWQEAMALQGDGWRLPNIYELIDLGWKGYWSSSPYAGNATSAWDVNFSEGGGSTLAKSVSFYVRLVRGEPTKQKPVSRKEMDYYIEHGHKMAKMETCCGLTEEQWRRVIDEEFVINFSNYSAVDAAKNGDLGTLDNLSVKAKHYLFTRNGGTSYYFAAIPDITGIRKPHFGGACPTKHEGRIVYKMKSGNWGDAESSADLFWEQEYDNNDIMEYIELP